MPIDHLVGHRGLILRNEQLAGVWGELYVVFEARSRINPCTASLLPEKVTVP